MEIPKNFVLIEGGTFQMASPETESWRSDDETQHTVTVSNFYMSQYELTQEEYEKVMGNNPGNFSGSDLTVDDISWLDAVSYCNARSESEGGTPVYSIDGQNVSWDRSANGYRLPIEAEWEYACPAGTVTPFNTETFISAEEANYYGHYPYMIEDNYFSQGNLDTTLGEYRQTTVVVNNFAGEIQRQTGAEEVSLAWLLTKVTSPVVGATKLHHIEGAVKAAELELSAEELFYLEELYAPHNLVGVMAQNTQDSAKESHVWSIGNQKI